MRVIIHVLNPAVAAKHEPENSESVRVVCGDIFECSEADCIVTPGNSFGIMDGGLDWYIGFAFPDIEERVQAAIMADPWRGELHVGSAIVLPLAAGKSMCYAPTMRTPSPCASGSINAYLAMRGALIACAAAGLKTVAVPLLCHGVGKMSPDASIRQIKHAHRTLITPTPRDWRSVVEDEDLLFGREWQEDDADSLEKILGANVKILKIE